MTVRKEKKSANRLVEYCMCLVFSWEIWWCCNWTWLENGGFLSCCHFMFSISFEKNPQKINPQLSPLFNQFEYAFDSEIDFWSKCHGVLLVINYCASQSSDLLMRKFQFWRSSIPFINPPWNWMITSKCGSVMVACLSYFNVRNLSLENLA